MKPEQATQKAVMDYLAAKRILAFRMNTGAVLSQYKGKTRMIRYGAPGMADVVAFTRKWQYLLADDNNPPKTIWLEIKAPKGKTTPEQDSFAALVREHGHSYFVIRSIEDLEAALKG